VNTISKGAELTLTPLIIFFGKVAWATGLTQSDTMGQLMVYSSGWQMRIITSRTFPFAREHWSPFNQEATTTAKSTLRILMSFGRSDGKVNAMEFILTPLSVLALDSVIVLESNWLISNRR
jgi:hypothetical protein